MAREHMADSLPKPPGAGDLSPHDAEPDPVSGGSGGAFQGAIDALGAFYAGVTGFAIGSLESFADRRAEARAARLRQRGAPSRPHLLRERARRISQRNHQA
jgi:hypothetical protein